MRLLTLDKYEVDGNSVRLFWHSEGLEHAFTRQWIIFSYDREPKVDADVAAFMFVNLVVPCYANLNDAGFELVFREPASSSVVTSLLEYHGLPQVTVRNDSSDRDTPRTEYEAPGNSYAVLYGGGKDSLLSAALHAEFYGARNVTLLRLVWDVDPEKLNDKREIFSESMRFMREKGFSTEYIDSDFHTVVINREVGKAPDIGLYHGAMAPLLKSSDFRHISHGYDAGHFHGPRRAGAEIPFRKTRPASLAHLKDAHSALTGRQTTIKNFNYPLNAGVAFKFLAKSFPDYLPNVYMCERLGRKWCLKCRKCFLYALSCMAYKVKCDFSLRYFFEKSTYISDFLEDLTEIDKPEGALPPYIKKFAYPTHVCSTVQIIRDIDLDYARNLIDFNSHPNSWPNFLAIAEAYRGVQFPDYDAFWLSAYDEEARVLENDSDGAVRAQLISLLHAANIPISEKVEFDGLNQDRRVKYTFRP